MEAVLLNSGGLDSGAVAKILSEQGHTLHSLYVDCGQHNADAAMAAAQKIADRYCVDHHVFSLGEELLFILPTREGGRTGVPFQSALTFTLGAIYATKLGVGYVASGLKEDAATEHFNERFMNLLKTSKLTKVPVPVLPLMREEGKTLSVADLVEILGVDVAKETHSCYKSPACGECGKCKKRAEVGI